MMMRSQGKMHLPLGAVSRSSENLGHRRRLPQTLRMEGSKNSLPRRLAVLNYQSRLVVVVLKGGSQRMTLSL